MATTTTHYIFHALSPLHFGTGVALGSIDLPISREANTGLPNAPGSGIKGVVKDFLRDQYRLPGAGQSHDKVAYRHALGVDPGEQESERAQSALSFGDGLLLAFPVRSLCGVFAWVTSPYVIHRLRRVLPQVPAAPAVSTGSCATAAGANLAANGHVYLHDLKLAANNTGNNASAASLAATLAALIFPGAENNDAVQAERTNFTARFAVVSDEDCAHLTTVGCEVRMRNALQPGSKIVQEGALWSEEYAPVETIFWGTLMADHINGEPGQQTLADFCQRFGPERGAQFGGKATVGKGVARLAIAPPKAGDRA